MEILKVATDWAKAELLSTPFFILFGLAFMSASFGFWKLGKSDMASAYIIPTLVAGTLLVIIGSGLLYTNIQRVSQFEKDYSANASSFVESEISRCEATLKEYKTIVFKVIPILIIFAALIIIFFSTPSWRAICITTIAMLTVILLIDGTAYARISSYHKELKLVEMNTDMKK